MKKYSNHLKKTNKSNKKVIIFTSATAVLASTIAVGSYLIFKPHTDLPPVQEQIVENNSADSNKNLKTQENSEAISVSKVKSYDNNSSITNSLSQNTNFETWNKNCDPALIVVNCNNPIPKNFNPSIVDFKEVQVSNIMKDSLYKMINDASKEGINLWISSAYRSINRQTELYNREVEAQKKNNHNIEEAKRLAAKVVAEPGTSEHNTGLAVDFNGVRDDFFKSKEYNWLEKNSAKYGFILRYKKEKSDITNVIFEPWHFRFVGEEHAKAMNEKDMCLEEYINYLNN